MQEAIFIVARNARRQQVTSSSPCLLPARYENDCRLIRRHLQNREIGWFCHSKHKGWKVWYRERLYMKFKRHWPDVWAEIIYRVLLCINPLSNISCVRE